MLLLKNAGAKYAITFNSGTSTLHAALAALNVNAGDEVIVPPLTVISNVDAFCSNGTVFEIDPDTFNICPKDIERKITKTNV